MTISLRCVIQEECVPEEIRPSLAVELIRVSNSLLGGTPDDVEVTFDEIPRGFGFRGGEPSTTSVIEGLIPDSFGRQKRGQWLREIGATWCEIVGCSPYEFAGWARELPAKTSG